MNPLRRVAVLGMVAFVTKVAASAADLPLTCEGYIGSGSNLFFRIRSGRPDGTAADSWHRLGESVAGYQLVRFEAKPQVLVVRDEHGKDRELALPEGRVQVDVRLSEEEFRALTKYIGFPPKTDAPVLSRETARALWLRLVEQDGAKAAPLPPDVILSFDGAGLPEKQRQDFLEAMKKQEGEREMAVLIGGADSCWVNIPRNCFELPEPFTRNLTSDDWHELDGRYLVAHAGETWRTSRPVDPKK